MKRNGTLSGKLSARQLAVIGLLIEGASIARAARSAGVGRSTIWRWLGGPDFKAALARTKAAIFDQTIGELKAATLGAGRKLVALIGSKTENTARLAATTILETGFRIREEEEIDARLTRLEKIVKQNLRAGESGE